MTKEELEAAIRMADIGYYKNGSSAFTDQQYDNMKNMLREMDPDNPLLQSLGEDHSEGFKKIKHERRMLSLEKVHEVPPGGELGRWANFFDWFKRHTDFDEHLAAVENDEDISTRGKALWHYYMATTLPFMMRVEPKVDGMSAEALYVDGKLVSVSTRGNGDEGDDITENVKHLFPAEVRVDPEHVIGTLPPLSHYPVLSSKFLLRGELYISKIEFERINAEQEAAGLETFKNARNLCAGTVKSKEGLQGRNVSFVAHDYVDISGALDRNPGTDMSLDVNFRALATYGVDIIPACASTADVVQLVSGIEYVDQNREHYPFVIDGAVIKAMYPRTRQHLGETDHHPKWAVAFKFLPEQKETTVRSITWQIGGKTGKATPVAEIEPVVLDGTLVSRATLSNAGRMAARGIAPGVKILICKSGEIIPFVSEVLTPVAVELAPTMECPSCGAEMYLEEGKAKDTANYICPNPNCREKAIAALKTAFGTGGLNVLGFGPETASAFVDTLGTDQGIRALIFDIVTAFKAEFPDSIAGKEADNLYAELGKTQDAPLHRWIAAMQFPGIAMGTAKKISQQCEDWYDFEAKVVHGELGLTTKQTDSILECLPGIRDALINNSRLRFNPKSSNYVETDTIEFSKLGGKAFVVTGRFQVGRSSIEALIPANGGILRSSVSKKTDYLVVGEDVGATKTKKAEECGTKVITEDEFLAMLQ